MIFCWEEPYETAGFVWRCFALAISHLLWDVFSTMKEKRAAWNRDGWKVNINFRSQNLSVCCRLKLSSSEKAAVSGYFLVCMNMFSCMWEWIWRQWVDDLIVHFGVWKAKMSIPLCICLCGLQWPLCPLMSSLMWFVMGQRESMDKIPSQLPIYASVSINVNAGDMILTLGVNLFCCIGWRHVSCVCGLVNNWSVLAPGWGKLKHAHFFLWYAILCH